MQTQLQDELNQMLTDYELLSVGQNTKVSFPLGTRWTMVNAELVRCGLAPMRDYNLESVPPAYPGLATFAIYKLTSRRPTLAKEAAEIREMRKEGRRREAKLARLTDSILRIIRDGRTSYLVPSNVSGKEREEAYAAALYVISRLTGHD